MKTYLIQRGEMMNRDSKKGIDSIILLNYMGAAEFEFGVIPQSLAKIREEINTYIYLDVPIQNKVVTVFCKESQKSEVKTYLIELSKDKMFLKCSSRFPSFLNDTQRSLKTDFWWDLENHLMFWRKDSEFEAKFKTAIVNKPA